LRALSRGVRNGLLTVLVAVGIVASWTAVTRGDSSHAVSAAARPTPRAPASEKDQGDLLLSTPGAEAVVWSGTTRLGTTPLRLRLRAGRDTFDLQPKNSAARIPVRTVVAPGDLVVVAQALAADGTLASRNTVEEN
jgi:hypothetical protein